MKKLFFAMLALVALASCSKDEVVQLNQDEIKYSVVAENATKAADVYCNNNLMETFKVWASTDNKMFITGDVVTGTKTSTTTTWKSNITRYWPATAVNFYAVAGTTEDITWENVSSSPAINDYTINSTVTLQEDLLYAYTTKTSQKAGNSDQVTLNFRHALSQVVFYAKNEHPNLYIEISEVKVAGLTSKGSFTYPSAVTDQNNYDGHTGTISNPTTGLGQWNLSDESSVNNMTFSVTGLSAILNPAKPITDGHEASTCNLTDIASSTTAHDTKNAFSKAMLLLPQAWSAYGPTPATEEPAARFYFGVKCKIYNVANPTWTDDNITINTTNEVLLYDAYALIPADIEWEQGKKYIYTFVFGAESNGGVEPEGDGGTPDIDNPVLTNINYTVTVDEFVPVDNEDVNWNVSQN